MAAIMAVRRHASSPFDAAFARRHQIQSALQQTKVEVDLQKGAQRWKE